MDRLGLGLARPTAYAWHLMSDNLGITGRMKDEFDNRSQCVWKWRFDAQDRLNGICMHSLRTDLSVSSVIGI